MGDVEIGGGSLPAVRVEMNLLALNRYGVPLEDVRAAIQASNATRPKGSIESDERRIQIDEPLPGGWLPGLHPLQQRQRCRLRLVHDVKVRVMSSWSL